MSFTPQIVFQLLMHTGPSWCVASVFAVLNLLQSVNWPAFWDPLNIHSTKVRLWLTGMKWPLFFPFFCLKLQAVGVPFCSLKALCWSGKMREKLICYKNVMTFLKGYKDFIFFFFFFLQLLYVDVKAFPKCISWREGIVLKSVSKSRLSHWCWSSSVYQPIHWVHNTYWVTMGRHFNSITDLALSWLDAWSTLGNMFFPSRPF